LLERVRSRLEVDAASIRLLDGEVLRLERHPGTGFPSLAQENSFYRQAVAAGHPLIVPDASLDQHFVLEPGSGPAVRFYAGIPLCLEAGQLIGFLNLFDTRPRSAATASQIAALAVEAMALVVQHRQERTIARLREELGAQARLIREQTDSLRHTKKTFDRASATARIGVWECDLPDGNLRWTDVVYQIFGFPIGMPVDRQTTLECYSETSRKELEIRRSRAIAERGSFSLDAEITALGGQRRWIRITASVECENGVAVRIFGMKQDITEEKILSERTRYLAEFDVMTGLANRSQFQSRLGELTQGSAGQLPVGALLLIDLDGFKQVNDSFGHAIGDECLKEAALRLADVCREADLVARIGGDEFAVLLGPRFDPVATEDLARQIVAVLGKPVIFRCESFKLGASVGSARAAAGEPSDLFKQADAALYAAKAGGRNTYRMFGRS
jgi:diguanylate cyclase (GGDEF)-like protein